MNFLKKSLLITSIPYSCFTISVYDPWANPDIVKHEYGIEVINELPEEKFDSVVLAVAHQLFTGIDIESLSKTRSVVFDVKGFLPKESVDGRL